MHKLPYSIGAKMAQKMARNATQSDLEIHDVVNCVAYFAYVNRVVAGLGVHPGGREGEPGQ